MSLNSSRTKKLEIEDIIQYGANRRLVTALLGAGFEDFREIQQEAIIKGVFNDVSMFVCSPSGSGKTLIGEMAVVNNVLTSSKKSLYLVPLRALASEKFEYFTEMYEYLDIKTVMAVGDQQVLQADLMSADLLIMTFEKFDSYLRTLGENPWIREINTVIVDEIHIIGEVKRGPRLEALLLRCYLRLNQIQVIALSATVANPENLGKWFKNLSTIFSKKPFQMISYNKRPIELDYGIVPTKNKLQTIMELSKPILDNHGQILVFTNSRRESEQVAEFLSDFTLPYLSVDDNSFLRNRSSDKNLGKLLSNNDISESLYNMILKGIGYHHAGLESNERLLIERLFLRGTIKIIVCTTTLSAGINTPARMVILKDTFIFEQEKTVNSKGKIEKKYRKKSLGKNVFHQILGRAGRPGYDKVGLARILTDTRAHAVDLQEIYFKKKKIPGGIPDNNNRNKFKFVPVYDDVLSSMQNKSSLIEFILLSIYEQENLQLDDLYNILEYSFFVGSKNNNKSFKKILYDIMDGEIIQLLKTHAKIDDLIQTELANMTSEITKFETNIIEGNVYSDDHNVKFKVKFDGSKGVYCDCKKHYMRKSSILKNETGGFILCPHQIVFLKFLLRTLDDKRFFLKRAGNESHVSSASYTLYKSEKIRNDSDTINPDKIDSNIEHIHADSRKHNLNNKDENGAQNQNIGLEMTSAADIYAKDVQENALSEEIVDINLSAIHRTTGEYNFFGEISRITAKKIIEKIINRAIRNENVIEYLLKNGLILYKNLAKVEPPNNNSDLKLKGKKSVEFEISDGLGSFIIPIEDFADDPMGNPVFFPTILGETIIKGYIYPHTGLLFKKLLRREVHLYLENLHNSGLNSNKKFSKDANDEAGNNSVYISRIFKILVDLIIQEDRSVPNFTEDILNLRMNGIEISNIHQKIIAKALESGKSSRIYQVDIKNFIEYSGRILRFMKDFSEVFILESGNSLKSDEFRAYSFLCKLIDTLYFRVEYGIPEKLVFLAKHFKSLTRENFEKLYHSGFRTINSLEKLSAEEFSSIIGIPMSKAEIFINRIKEK